MPLDDAIQPAVQFEQVMAELRQLRRGAALARPGSVLQLSSELRRTIALGRGEGVNTADEVAVLISTIRRGIARLPTEERAYAEVDFNIHPAHNFPTLTERQESLASAERCAAKTVRRRSHQALETLSLLLTQTSSTALAQASADGESRSETEPNSQINETPWKETISEFWNAFPGSRIDIVCSEIPADECPSFASPTDRNYLRYAKFADLDSLIYVRTRLTQACPDIDIRDFSPSEYWEADPDTLVILGGPPWNAKYREFLPQLPYHFESHPLGEDDPLVIPLMENGKYGPGWTEGDNLLSDISVFTRLTLNQGTTVFLVAGCLTLGVLGAAKCFLQGLHGARNVHYINEVVKNRDFVLVAEVHKIGGIPTMADLEKTGPLVLLERRTDGRFFPVEGSVAQRADISADQKVDE